MEAEIVADLHDARRPPPDDEPLRALIEDLRASQPRFAALWERAPGRPRTRGRKTIAHPEVGRSRSTATCSASPAATCG